MGLVWIIIPLAGIALAGFAEWLKYKRQAAGVGPSSEEVRNSLSSLEDEVNALRNERDLLVRRVQNLEAIVTSEAWDSLGTDRDLAASKTPPPLADSLEEVESEEEKAARMARRLRS